MLERGTLEDMEAPCGDKCARDGGRRYVLHEQCIYTGMPLASYERMLKMLREDGSY